MTYIDAIPNPAGYREAAAVLRRRADDLAYYAQRVESIALATIFEGPAADRFRSDISHQKATVLHICGELHTYANSLSAAAAAYEAERAAWTG